ncbi:MAG: hypothetical protein HY673_19025 [Chloroflexi bacterium]|nr:hypothetical protein [Chloroflexota bacterium]
MADLKLTFAMSPYDRMLPLISGEVKPDGITLEYVGLPGAFSRVFYEQMKFGRYDVSEMSVSNFLRMRSVGWPFLMLPVFHNRNFSHTNIRIRRSSGIRQGHPEDLKGKRFGIHDYLQTVGLWARGIIHLEFGVAPEDMVWVQESPEHLSYGGAGAEAGLARPANVTVRYATANLNTLFARGELDAAVTPTPVPIRPPRPGAPEEDVVTLFPDPRQEAIRFFKKTGVYPPHHTTVVRASILEQHPWAATSLMEAFEESKRIAARRLRELPPSLLVFGAHFINDIDQVFGPDPLVYGIKANARAIDMVQDFAVRQGVAPRKYPVDEIFPKELIYREERLD